MNDLNTRIKNYLASKKPKPAESAQEVEIEVVQVEDNSSTLGYIFIAITLSLLLYQAFKYGEVENQCYLNKECKEWIEKQ